MQTMPAKLIVTRPMQNGAAFAQKVVTRCGYDVPLILAPGLKIIPLQARIPSDMAHVIFTSSNGVAQAGRLKVPTAAHAWCVGERTSQAASSLGFQTTMGGGDAQQLLETILDERPNGRIVHIAGQHARGDIVNRLMQADLNCTSVVAYDQKTLAPPQNLINVLSGDQPVVIPLFSARSGLILTAVEWRAPTHVIAISPYVADMLTEWGADTVHVAERPDESTMITATCRVLDRLKDDTAVT